MPQTYYPTALDLLYFLEVSISEVPEALRRFLEAQVNGARQDLEGGDGCDRVFLAGEVETRYYDPPRNRGSVLRVDDLASVTSVVFQPAGGSTETLTLHTDYLLEPRNALVKGEPYTQIRFPNRYWSDPLASTLYNSIRVTGRFGYATTVPDNIWLAILSRAAYKVYQANRAGATGGILSWKDGDRSVEYGVQPTQDLVDNWASQYASAVSAYRRLTL